MGKLKRSTGVLMSVAVLLPVILYIVYFWRSGIFSSSEDLSKVFAPGSFTQERTLLPLTVDIPERTVGGVTYRFNADNNTWYLDGLCTEGRTVSIGRIQVTDIPSYVFLNYDYSEGYAGTFYTYLPSTIAPTSELLTFYPMRGQVVFEISSLSGIVFNLYLREGVDYTGCYFTVNSSYIVKSEDFNDFRVVDHTPGSFGDFLCNNFSVHELNCIVSEPVITAIGAVSGEISPHSAYNVYVISAYCVYIILIWVVLLIVKVITFVPAVITRFIDKLGGGG